MLTLRVDLSDRVATVPMAGEVDPTTAPKLRNVALGALSDGASILVVACAGVTFIDSAGLSALLEVRASAEAEGGMVIIRHPPPMVLRTLQITCPPRRC